MLQVSCACHAQNNGSIGLLLLHFKWTLTHQSCGIEGILQCTEILVDICLIPPLSSLLSKLTCTTTGLEVKLHLLLCISLFSPIQNWVKFMCQKFLLQEFHKWLKIRKIKDLWKFNATRYTPVVILPGSFSWTLLQTTVCLLLQDRTYLHFPAPLSLVITVTYRGHEQRLCSLSCECSHREATPETQCQFAHPSLPLCAWRHKYTIHADYQQAWKYVQWGVLYTFFFFCTPGNMTNLHNFTF